MKEPQTLGSSWTGLAVQGISRKLDPGVKNLKTKLEPVMDAGIVGGSLIDYSIGPRNLRGHLPALGTPGGALTPCPLVTRNLTSLRSMLLRFILVMAHVRFCLPS